MSLTLREEDLVLIKRIEPSLIDTFDKIHHPNYRIRRPLQTASFLKLLAEICNQIYQNALVSPRPVELWPFAQCWQPRLFNPPDTEVEHRYERCLATTFKRILGIFNGIRSTLKITRIIIAYFYLGSSR